MAGAKSKKRVFVEISSSEESESPPPESDDSDVEEISSSTSCNEEEEEDDDGWNHSEDEEENEALIDADEDCNDADSMCNKVIQFIQGGRGSNHQELKLDECKAYLRRHNLRVSGTKEQCIQRIKEHKRLKDGNGEILYPRSSFIINCTGDVCRGDTVLFHQKVYQTSGKFTRSRSLGRRTVAGKIIKESYGAAKQQHTFTVEVLWSKGTKKLDPLFPLLVKGRNLYKLKTFRQLWKNEKDRLEVLSEKHRRGDAARTVRAMRMTKVVMKTDKFLTCKGAKRSKQFHHLSSSRTRETTQAKKNCVNDMELAKNKKQINSQTPARFCTKQNLSFEGSASCWRHQNLTPSYQISEIPCLPHNYPSHTFYHLQSGVSPRELHNLHYYGGPPSTSGLPYPRPLPYSGMDPISDWKQFSHGRSIDPGYYHSKNGNEARSSNCFPRLMDSHRSSLHSNTNGHRWR